MKLLTKGHSVVVKAASKDDTRYILQSVYIEETKMGMKTTATDGKMLAIVEDLKAGFTAEDYPANVIPATAQNGAKAAIVPAEAFAGAFKSLPKGRGTLPVLQTVAVVMGATETTLGTTDLQCPTVKTTKNIEGNFPNYNQVIPKGKPSLVIGFAPALLGRALKIAEDFGLYSVRMEFTDGLSSVKMTGEKDGQSLTLVVMPVRL